MALAGVQGRGGDRTNLKRGHSAFSFAKETFVNTTTKLDMISYCTIFGVFLAVKKGDTPLPDAKLWLLLFHFAKFPLQMKILGSEMHLYVLHSLNN